jgi:hypothetical protein
VSVQGRRHHVPEADFDGRVVHVGTLVQKGCRWRVKAHGYARLLKHLGGVSRSPIRPRVSLLQKKLRLKKQIG